MARHVGPYHDAVNAYKRSVVIAALLEHGGNRGRAARQLGLQRTYLMRLIREHEITIPAPCGACRRTLDGRACRNHAQVPA